MEPPTDAAGGRKTIKQAVLEAGSSLLQDARPLGDFDIHVNGFHCAKDEPDMQMDAHHYCRQVNGDLLQCVLFDGDSADANLIGIEYIVSERLYESLPEEEKSSWHPHNYEVLSGTLVAPGLPEAAEKAMMRELVNSYGKTWHTWDTGRRGSIGDALPLGDARLMWSFNRDGETDPELVLDRDRDLGVSSEEKRRQRADLAEDARPQRGVDALRDAFPHADGAPDGVEAAPERARSPRSPDTTARH